ncbi:ATP-binding protein [Streptomyces boncukensis]|uniref:ATP-binding protein n=1 Tax=Streptomyces boncukensis TaxID=2711219 RepID=A0A6G4WVD8_9ACTN|nr:ATP-binding protein [Streptomyces boncukensis]NGO68590.1 ATP-binding protein [Streptomyces boncukensis]
MGTEGSTVLEPLWQGLPTLDAASVSASASCALPPRYEAVKSARDFTRQTLRRWEISEQGEDVALVVSELVTNAMRHGLPSSPHQGAEPPVRLHLMRWSARLVCAVRDPSSKPPEVAQRLGLANGSPDGIEGVDGELGELAEFPELPELTGTAGLPGFTAESGRGLCLVDTFSDSWGWHPLPGPVAGKVVWALFHLREG